MSIFRRNKMKLTYVLWFFVIQCIIAFIAVSECVSQKTNEVPLILPNSTVNNENNATVQLYPRFYHLNMNTNWQEKRFEIRQQQQQQQKGPCSCAELNCGCCAGMRFRRFKRIFCSNFTYDPNEFQVQLDVMNNDEVVYQNMFSAKNPPPMCVPVPYTPATMCIKLFNIFTPGRNLHMCMDMEGKVNDKPYVVLHFDCMRMGQDGIKYPLKPEQNGGEIGGGGGGGGGGLFGTGLFGNRPTAAPTDSTDVPQVDIDTFDPVTEIKIKH